MSGNLYSPLECFVFTLYLHGSENLKNGMTAMIRGINQRGDLNQILKQESSDNNNFETLTICECDNLINLVPSPTSFQNLTTLSV